MHRDSAKHTLTIRDVASAAGVSMATVSDIVGGRGERYRDATNAKVLRVAARLGYRPHAGARAMRNRRFNTIGLVVSQAPRWESLLIEGVDGAAVALQIGLMLVHVPNADCDLPAIVTRMQVDGLIADWSIPSKVSQAIARYEIPTIWVNSDQQEMENCIWPDDVAGGRIATEHLLARGHRRIAFVGVRQASHMSHALRLRGYRQAMQKAGLGEQTVLLDCPAEPPAAIKDAAWYQRRFSHGQMWDSFAADGQPTACVTYNCDTARELYAACARRGVSLADAFAVCACDDLWAESMFPSLSSVMVDHVAMGKIATEMLWARIEQGGRSLPSRILPVHLIERESSDGGRAVLPTSSSSLSSSSSSP